jgi:NAD-dependent SIR2 family protein deacetylase
MLKSGTSEYKRLHERIAKTRGPAKNYLCIDCPSEANDWSWIHDTDQMNVLNYNPRCRKCHLIYDEVKFPGELNGRAKLSLLDVEEIRSKYASGGYSHRDLAYIYGISRGHIARILSGKRWLKLLPG